MASFLPELMIAGGLALFQAMPAYGQETTAQPLDISAVTEVAITGEAASVRLSTDPGRPYRASAGSVRTGWFAKWYSSWLANDCAASTRMRIDGGVLRVQTVPASWLDPSDCSVRIDINMPARGSVSIEQQAFMAKLTGLYERIAVAARAADFTMDGRARTVTIDGDAVRAHIAFSGTGRDETIAIRADALDAHLEFGKDVPIGYSVEATASFVDSAIPSTPGTGPQVSLAGKFVRATIRRGPDGELPGELP